MTESPSLTCLLLLSFPSYTSIFTYLASSLYLSYPLRIYTFDLQLALYLTLMPFASSPSMLVYLPLGYLLPLIRARL